MQPFCRNWLIERRAATGDRQADASLDGRHGSRNGLLVEAGRLARRLNFLPRHRIPANESGRSRRQGFDTLMG
jgi:hypothetical protein